MTNLGHFSVRKARKMQKYVMQGSRARFIFCIAMKIRETSCRWRLRAELESLSRSGTTS
jgi:hypothetical protein